MRIAVFGAKRYDRDYFTPANAAHGFELTFLEPRLTADTVGLAAGCDVACVFVNDQVPAAVVDRLADGGTRMLALRSAGFNHVDLEACRRRHLTVARVPAYSPHAVAEHAVALMLTLNRKTHKAYGRVRDGNFALDGLVGFDLHGKTAGVVGTGQIGLRVCRILAGFGCKLLAFDPYPTAQAEAAGAAYVPLDRLLEQSDVVTLHCPLTADTRHLIDAAAVAKMKPGVMLINTGRGALVDTPAVVAGLKSGAIGYLGLDVYEEEAGLFFEDHTADGVTDDVLARLLSFPTVLVTGHQAFLTREALAAIADTTLDNVARWAAGRPCPNRLVG